MTTGEATVTISADQKDFDSTRCCACAKTSRSALRAAAHHGLAEGVCNHFSVELPDGSGRFLLNPRGLLWSEVQADDIVMVDAHGRTLAGRHAVEPTAMFIHAAIHRLGGKACVLHTHMPYATALTLTADRASTRRCRRTRCAFMAASRSTRTTTAWRSTPPKASGSPRRWAAPTSPSSATTASSSAASAWRYAYDDLYYLERACMAQVLAQSTGRPLVPVEAPIAERVRDQTLGERLQSELFFEALRRGTNVREK